MSKTRMVGHVGPCLPHFAVDSPADTAGRLDLLFNVSRTYLIELLCVPAFGSVWPSFCKAFKGLMDSMTGEFHKARRPPRHPPCLITHRKNLTDSQNAGLNVPAIPMEDLTTDQFRSLMDVNVTACFLCAQQAIRIMKTQEPKGGR